MGATKRSGAAAVAMANGSPKVNGSAGISNGTEQRSCLTSQLRKTKICVYHLKGACQYGANCAFAHSCTELQSTPDLRKTRLCQAYEQGACSNPDCSFAHGEEELRSTNLFYKKTLCIWNQKGKCRNGEQCRFAHGTAELRTNQGNVPAPPGLAAEPAAHGPRRTKPAAVSGGNGTKQLKEPMKVLPAGCLTATAPQVGLAAEADLVSPQPVGVPPVPFSSDAALPASGIDAAWWQWPLGYGVPVPPMVPGLAGSTIEDLSADLERLRQSVTSEDISVDLERLRGDVISLNQKCSQLQMQIHAAADPTYTGMFMKTGGGFDLDSTGGSDISGSGSGHESLPTYWA